MSGFAPKRIVLETKGPGLHEFTQSAVDFVGACMHGQRPGGGLLTIFVRHTSCSLLIQENADPSVRRDLDAFFRRLVPPADDPSMRWISHRSEGADDMPAHIKAALTAVSLSIPVIDRKLALGTWQGIYLFEHRDRPHRREIVMHLTG